MAIDGSSFGKMEAGEAPSARPSGGSSLGGSSNEGRGTTQGPGGSSLGGSSIEGRGTTQGPVAPHREHEKWKEYLHNLIVETSEDIAKDKREAASKACALLQVNIAPNPLRMPKTSRFPKRSPLPRVPGMSRLPKKVPTGVVVSSTFSIFYQFAKQLAKGFVQFLCHYAKKIILIALFACIAIRILRYLRNTEVTVEEPIPARVVLIICDDVLAHDASRKALQEILKNPNFFAVVPTCVIEGLKSGWDSVDVDKSFCAYVASQFIFDLRHLGKIENATQLDELKDYLGWNCNITDDYVQIVPEPQLTYEEGIFSCAQSHQHAENPSVLAVIMTNSKKIKARAIDMGLRCDVPSFLLSWSKA